LPREIVASIVARELEKEGVNPIQALRIGGAIAKVLGAMDGSHTVTD